ARNSQCPLGTRPFDRARRARGALPRRRRRLHDCAEAAADHARQGPRRARRFRARTRVPRRGQQGAHAEALPVRHGAARVRRLALAARAARARHASARDARGARRDPRAPEQARAGVTQMSPMSAYLADWLPLIQSLGWTLLHFLWQGAVIAAGYAAI